MAEAGGAIWLQKCRSTQNVQGGLFANIGGRIRDDNGVHNGNVRGCRINAGSNIEVNGSDLSESDTSNAEVLGGALTAYGSTFNKSKAGAGVFCTGAAWCIYTTTARQMIIKTMACRLKGWRSFRLIPVILQQGMAQANLIYQPVNFPLMGLRLRINTRIQ